MNDLKLSSAKYSGTHIQQYDPFDVLKARHGCDYDPLLARSCHPERAILHEDASKVLIVPVP